MLLYNNLSPSSLECRDSTAGSAGNKVLEVVTDLSEVIELYGSHRVGYRKEESKMRIFGVISC